MTSNSQADQQADVIVLGGGPAGTAAAFTLARAGRQVIVLERSAYEGVRLGEMLPPAARPLLGELGVWEQFQRDGHLPSPGIVACWGGDEPYENDFIFTPYGHGWQLDRRRFDAMLARAAEAAGVIVCMETNVIAQPRLSAGQWQIKTLSAGCNRAFRASFLIDATGRKAALALRQGSRKVIYDRLVAAVGFYGLPVEARSNDARTWVEAAANGWWYSALLPDDRLILAYLTDADLLPRHKEHLRLYWDTQLQQTRLTQQRVNANAARVDFRLLAANTSTLDLVSGLGWLAVGDAATAFDPLSSHGITYALESGLRAARAVQDLAVPDQASAEEYGLWVNSVFNKYLQGRAFYYGLERRWPNSAFWLRRQMNPRLRQAIT